MLKDKSVFPDINSSIAEFLIPGESPNNAGKLDSPKKDLDNNAFFTLK